jgi:hypothetical protein
VAQKEDAIHWFLTVLLWEPGMAICHGNAGTPRLTFN